MSFDIKAWRLKNKEKVLAYNRKWNQEHPEATRAYYLHKKEQRASYSKSYLTAHPEIKRAHNIVNNLIRARKLMRLPCVVCKSPRSQGHHQDYSKPTEVIWLCQTHHAQVHLQEKAA